ncbi:glycosyltransferase [Neotamlana laminarinivorans]|uniref:Glycosyltransferase n=1 Tax=Neotamlana laminarinivorans TaxID=2883124 RepID=A0A9X1I070_9FLAO|nr:glycosyltransferase [Tamlana laminarinivorans]MCB4799006.1 glycosyltransferase [Tamlana laminarinivorans]
MKILRVITSMKPQTGGPCQGIRNAIPEQLKMGVQNEVVCLDNPDEDYGIIDEFIIYKLGRPTNAWFYSKTLDFWLLDNLKRFDVVIIHGLWLYPSYGTIKIIQKYKIANARVPKVYIMPHGMLDPYFQKAKGRTLKAIRNFWYWHILEHKVINKANGVLFTCEQELLLARQNFSNYKPKKEINVGYGIQNPPELLSKNSEELLTSLKGWDKKPYLLFLSRIHPKKGVDLLIKAYLKLELKYKTLPQLVVAGPGLDTEFGKAMLELASGSNNILFPGMLKGDIKWKAFNNAEVFILPSHQENFGIAVAEALATSTPVLISDKVNIWREIEEGHGGFVNKDTLSDTYQLVRKWLDAPQTIKTEMTQNASNVFKHHFTIEKAAKKFISSIQ